jgi:hypothetical protein
MMPFSEGNYPPFELHPSRRAPWWQPAYGYRHMDPRRVRGLPVYGLPDSVEIVGHWHEMTATKSGASGSKFYTTYFTSGGNLASSGALGITMVEANSGVLKAQIFCGVHHVDRIDRAPSVADQEWEKTVATTFHDKHSVDLLKDAETIYFAWGWCRADRDDTNYLGLQVGGYRYNFHAGFIQRFSSNTATGVVAEFGERLTILPNGLTKFLDPALVNFGLWGTAHASVGQIIPR